MSNKTATVVNLSVFALMLLLACVMLWWVAVTMPLVAECHARGYPGWYPWTDGIRCVRDSAQGGKIVVPLSRVTGER